VHYYDEGDKEFVRQVQLWLYFLVTGIETEEEELDAVKKLKTYIEHADSVQNISKACLQFTNSFFTASFEKQMYRLCSRHYIGRWFGWVSESSFVESSNRSLQYAVAAPKITDPLHRSGDKILQHTRETHQKRQAEAVVMTQKSLPNMDNGSNTRVNEVLLSKHIIPEIREKAFDEWTLSKNYHCILAGNGKKMSDGKENQLVFFVEYSLPSPTTTNHCHPIYRRTRTVTVSEIILGGESHLCYQCSCHHLNLRKFCCRHIYRLLLRQPCKSDFLPECYKSYEVKYGIDMHYTGAVNELKQILHQCNGIVIKGSIAKWDLRELKLQESDAAFKSNPQQSVDVNPMTTVSLLKGSTVLKGSGHRLTVKMSESALANLQTYPLFNMITEHVKDAAGREIVRGGLHNIFEQLLTNNNKGNVTLPGNIATTGNLTTSRSAYKRKKPPGSPTHADRAKRIKCAPEKTGEGN
jgi:hypothetical protein